MRVCSLQPALQVDNAGVSQLGAPACGIVYKCSNLPGCLWACPLDGRIREDAKSVHQGGGAPETASCTCKGGKGSCWNKISVVL